MGDIHYRIAHKVYVLAHKVFIEADKALDKMDLSLTGYKFLHLLDMKGSKSQAELSKFCGITPAASSKRMKTLVDKKLVSIKVNPDNRKENLVDITPKGKKTLEKGRKVLNETAKEIFKDGKDLKAFEKELDNLLEKLMVDCK